MPDADWVRYRSLRGAELPKTATFLGATPYALDSTLKFDFYAATGIYRRVDAEGVTPSEAPDRLLVKVYHDDPWWCPPLGLLGRYLAHRERHYLKRLRGIEGVPAYLEDFGRTGLVREFLDGVNLREYFRGQRKRVNSDYFPRLFAILGAIHARGVAHNDLSKPENVLVLPDGSPAIIDLQIALELFPRWLGRPVLAYLQRVDRDHLRKLHRRQRPEDFSAAELSKSRRRDLLNRFHGFFLRRPYRFVRHLVLGRFLTDPAAPPPTATAVPKAYMFRHESTPPSPHVPQAHSPATPSSRVVESGRTDP